MTVGPQSRLQGEQNRPYGAVSGRAEITAVIVVVLVIAVLQLSLQYNSTYTRDNLAALGHP